MVRAGRDRAEVAQQPAPGVGDDDVEFAGGAEDDALLGDTGSADHRRARAVGGGAQVGGSLLRTDGQDRRAISAGRDEST